MRLDNYKELASAQGKEMIKQIDHHLDQIKSNHEAWAKEFEAAEKARREEEKEWQKFYWEVYTEDTAWWKSTIMFALNGIQLWALTEQYKQQKEIADRTFDLANRQLKIAESMYDRYKAQFQPHETALGGQINGYFASPYKPQYKATGGRMMATARLQMVGKRREVLMCASQYCTGATRSALNELISTEAKLISAGMNSAVKYENSRADRMENKWLQARLAMVQAGRGLAGQGLEGANAAAKAFASFGADPGAALSSLLGTAAYTIGGLISAPTRPQYSPSGGSYGTIYRPSTKVAVNTTPKTSRTY
jgi:hypothetical protein